MHPDINESLHSWVKALPASKMIRPDSLSDQLKYVFWSLYTPYHPHVRNTAQRLGLREALVRMGVMSRGERQEYLLGTIPKDQSMAEFISFLVDQGFGNHFVAWKDHGEVVSLRYVESFTRQYHVRVFEDGEVRGHYEYTPECYPIKHLKETDVEHRHEHFLALLGQKIIPLHTPRD